MKFLNILLSLSALFLLLGNCSNDEDPRSEIAINQGSSSYNLSVIKNYVPLDKLFESKIIVFEDEIGNEMTFDVSAEEYEETINLDDGTEFTYETIKFRLNNDENELNLNISISATKSNEVISEYLNANLIAFDLNGAVPGISIFDDGKPLFCEYTPGSYQINNKQFSGVYIMTEQTGITKYSQFFYSTNFGIIGFEDRNSNLWNLKEIL